MKKQGMKEVEEIVKAFANSGVESETIACPTCSNKLKINNFKKEKLTMGWCATSGCIEFSQFWKDL